MGNCHSAYVGSGAARPAHPGSQILRTNGSDVAFVTVTITDANEEIVPRSQNVLYFSIKGPGEIVALDNGDPTSFESFQGNQRRAFNGLALVVVRSIAGEPGKVVLNARSDGLRGASVTLQSQRPSS